MNRRVSCSGLEISRVLLREVRALGYLGVVCLLAFLRERECTSTSAQGDLVVSGHSGAGITGGCVSLSEHVDKKNQSSCSTRALRAPNQ